MAADASVGPGGDGAGLERFRLPSQASYDKLQARPHTLICLTWVLTGGAGCRLQAGLVALPLMHPTYPAPAAWAATPCRRSPSLPGLPRPAQQADPGALDGSPELAAEFEAAPWLLPPRTTALPYAGVTGFDALLELRAAEVPGLNTSKAVSFLTSTLHDPLTTALTQNCSERGGQAG